MTTAAIILIALWAWPIIGIAVALAYAAHKTKNDNPVIQFIGLCLGFLAGIVLGPFAISLFFQNNGPHDSMGSRG